MKSMKVAFIGSRGIPANYGGFETFVEKIAEKLQLDPSFEIVVIGDCEQRIKTDSLREYLGIELDYSKYSKTKNPILFFFDSMMKSWKSDIIYCCGVGNAFTVFLPFIFRKKYVTNPDGVGWKRLKYSKLGRKFLKLMFVFTALFSPYIVCDSFGIENIFRKIFFRKKHITTIEYGADLNKMVNVNSSKELAVLQKYNLVAQQYHLIVSRLEPENNIDVIVSGYCDKSRKFPLIIVGKINDTEYINSLRKMANRKILFLDGIYNHYELAVVRANAFSYFHGHMVGGTNPSLLEAMASKNLCVCHENEFNKRIVEEDGFYFKTNSEVSLVLEDIENNNYNSKREGVYCKIKEYYNWDNITDKYLSYFKKIG